MYIIRICTVGVQMWCISKQFEYKGWKVHYLLSSHFLSRVGYFRVFFRILRVFVCFFELDSSCYVKVTCFRAFSSMQNMLSPESATGDSEYIYIYIYIYVVYIFDILKESNRLTPAWVSVLLWCVSSKMFLPRRLAKKLSKMDRRL